MVMHSFARCVHFVLKRETLIYTDPNTSLCRIRRWFMPPTRTLWMFSVATDLLSPISTASDLHRLSVCMFCCIRSFIAAENFQGRQRCVFLIMADMECHQHIDVISIQTIRHFFGKQHISFSRNDQTCITIF